MAYEIQALQDLGILNIYIEHSSRYDTTFQVIYKN